jgi:hypothetical protein
MSLFFLRSLRSRDRKLHKVGPSLWGTSLHARHVAAFALDDGTGSKEYALLLRSLRSRDRNYTKTLLHAREFFAPECRIAEYMCWCAICCDTNENPGRGQLHLLRSYPDK